MLPGTLAWASAAQVLPRCHRQVVACCRCVTLCRATAGGRFVTHFQGKDGAREASPLNAASVERCSWFSTMGHLMDGNRNKKPLRQNSKHSWHWQSSEEDFWTVSQKWLGLRVRLVNRAHLRGVYLVSATKGGNVLLGSSFWDQILLPASVESCGQNPSVSSCYASSIARDSCIFTTPAREESANMNLLKCQSIHFNPISMTEVSHWTV